MSARNISTPLAIVAIAAFALLGSACLSQAESGPSPTATPAETSTPSPTLEPSQRYRTKACPFNIPSGRVVECGYLNVPENRTDPHSRSINVAVAVMKSEHPDPRPDPIVYLSGGPGGSILEIAYLVFEGRFGPFVADRDVILVDQRGVGESRPALDCPRYNDAYVHAAEQDIRRDELQALVIDAMESCKERLESQQIDLSGYNSAESATDIAELRQALGIEEWNLYGISYGTRLALTVMRDHPEGIRSVILDSSYPPQADLYAEVLPNAKRAFDAFFNGCRSDAVCASAFPDLERTFFDLVDRLNTEPAELEVYNLARDETIRANMNGDLLLASMFSALYDTSSIPFLPAVIDAAAEGDADVLTPLLGDLFFTYDTISDGMHYSVQCREEVPFGSIEAYEASMDQHPNLRHMFDIQPIGAICETWGVPPADPKENQPVRSDIPTLVLAGEYDPITPPRWGEQVANDLSQSHFYRFPAVGHGASVADFCPLEITLAFLERPRRAPDASCISQMPETFFFDSVDY